MRSSAGHERLQVLGRVVRDAFVAADRERVEEPPHRSPEEPPAPGEAGDRGVDRSAEHPHQRVGAATGTGLRRQAPPVHAQRADHRGPQRQGLEPHLGEAGLGQGRLDFPALGRRGLVAGPGPRG
jgi:hypothetical protein